MSVGDPSKPVADPEWTGVKFASIEPFKNNRFTVSFCGNEYDFLPFFKNFVIRHSFLTVYLPLAQLECPKIRKVAEIEK